MDKYLKKVKEVKEQILSYEIQHILRSENARAERLARLATSQMVDLNNNVYIEMLEAPSIKEIKVVLCKNSKLS